ncbi:MAG: DUF5522 domain-containing protein [Actinomycetes bacterium]
MSHHDPPLVPRPDRLDPSRLDYEIILSAHAAAVARGESTYRDPATSFLVFTSATLLARGSCCERGCRHCPFDPSSMPH